ncbi:hypothetical protein B0A50_08008 [Salinomyces thailandicus]|uniref:Uncharacterized protein n=1 Tax=Salinomyces thailandicus TaxID=706561 RepID=A0A4U0TLE2_9PEZI|nr:hypothetical protein B0A50_08008 [Salinomyces thailandica]
MQNTTEMQPFRLFDLPQELLDSIFDLAYPRQSASNITFRDDWDRDELQQRRDQGSQYQVRPFPTPKVADWMISKRFFLLAARSWMGNQHFGGWAGGAYKHSASSLLTENNGLFVDFAHEALGLSFFDCHDLQQCKRLQIVEIEVSSHDMDLDDSTAAKFCWETLFDEAEIARLPIVASLEGLQVTRAFHVKAGYCHYARTDAEKSTWEQNVARLDALLRQKVVNSRLADDNEKQGKNNTTSSAICQPLFSGSKVCATCPKRLKNALLPGFAAALQRVVKKAAAPSPSLTAQKVRKLTKSTSPLPSKASRKPRGDGIPETASELVEMMAEDPKKVAAWILGVQRRQRRAKLRRAKKRVDDVGGK